MNSILIQTAKLENEEEDDEEKKKIFKSLLFELN